MKHNSTEIRRRASNFKSKVVKNNEAQDPNLGGYNERIKILKHEFGGLAISQIQPIRNSCQASILRNTHSLTNIKASNEDCQAKRSQKGSRNTSRSKGSQQSRESSRGKRTLGLITEPPQKNTSILSEIRKSVKLQEFLNCKPIESESMKVAVTVTENLATKNFQSLPTETNNQPKPSKKKAQSTIFNITQHLETNSSQLNSDGVKSLVSKNLLLSSELEMTKFRISELETDKLELEKEKVALNLKVSGLEEQNAFLMKELEFFKSLSSNNQSAIVLASNFKELYLAVENIYKDLN